MDLAALWEADGVSQEAGAELMAAVYDEVVVRGPVIDRIRLTPTALPYGLALALPERVRLDMARPEGLEPPTL